MSFNFKKFPILETDRLILRKTSLKDSLEVLKLRSDKEIIKYINRDPTTKVEEAEDFIVMITKGMAKGENINWSITLKSDPKMIGSICFWNFSVDRKRAEIGYDLLTDHQGKRIMSEAIKSVLHYGFTELELDKIEAFTHYKNASSRYLLLKNGFYLNENKKDKHDSNNIVFEINNTKQHM